MGNNQSNAAAIDHSQLDSIARSFPQVQLDDEKLYVTSPLSRRTTRYDTGHFRQSKELLPEEPGRNSGTSPQSSVSNVDTLEDGERIPLSQPSSAADIDAGGQLNIQAAILIIQELTKSASPEQIAVLQKAVSSLTGNSTHVEPPTPSNEVRRTRRRTLLTPGLATRRTATSKSGSGSEVSSPVREAQQRPWSQDMFGQSPLSKLAGWQSANDGRPEIARSSTPDFNASYLGAHQLGSLRVMNASPVPSVNEQRLQPKTSNLSSRQGDYYTASEGSGRDTPSNKVSSSYTIEEEQSQTPRERPRIPLVQLEDTDADQSFASSTVSNGRDTMDNSEVEAETTEIRNQATLTVGGTEERPVSAMNMYSLEASSNPFLSQPDPYLEENVGDNQQHLESADSSMTNEYDVEQEVDSEDNSDYIPPPSRDPPQLPQLAFLRRAPLSASSSVYSNSVPPKPTRRAPTAPAPAPAPVTAPKASTTPTPTRPKFDSGYGSQTSLRTLKDEPVIEEEGPTTGQIDPPGPRNEPGVSRIEDQSMEPEHQQEEVMQTIEVPYAPLTREPTLPQLPPPSPPAARHSVDVLTTPPRRERPVEYSPYSQTTLTTPSKSNQNSPSRPLLRSQPNSATTSPQTRLLQRKLQKRRPRSEILNTSPLIVQAAVSSRTDFDGVPRVPSALNHRYKNRMSANPSMENLERTYKSVSHSASRESLIDDGVQTVEIRFPSPTRASPRAQSTERGRKHRKSDGGQPGLARRFWRSLSGSRSRSNSVQYPEDETPLGVADFGDISTSLGTSPYDLARSVGDRKPDLNKELPHPRTMKHPHQMSLQAPRKKLGMDDKAASAFALQRSRDRLNEFDFGLPDPSKREMRRQPTQGPLHVARSRPHSFHSTHTTNGPSSFGLSKETLFAEPASMEDETEGAPFTNETPPASETPTIIPWQPRNTRTNEGIPDQPRHWDPDSHRNDNGSGWGDYSRPRPNHRKAVGMSLKYPMTMSSNSGDSDNNNTSATSSYSHDFRGHTDDSRGYTNDSRSATRSRVTILSPIPSRVASPSPSSSPSPSPSISVKQRAAAIERNNSSGSGRAAPIFPPPCPTRRPPSPPRPAPRSFPVESQTRSPMSMTKESYAQPPQAAKPIPDAPPRFYSGLKKGGLSTPDIISASGSASPSTTINPRSGSGKVNVNMRLSDIPMYLRSAS